MSRWFRTASRLASGAGRAWRVPAVGVAAGVSMGLFGGASFSKERVYGPGAFMGEGLRAELWKARHENVAVLETMEDAGCMPQLLLSRLRNKDTDPATFRATTIRLLRMLVEYGENELPHEEVEVETPAGYKYEGVQLAADVKVAGVTVTQDGREFGFVLQQCMPSQPCVDAHVERDAKGEVTPVKFSTKLPADLADRYVVVLDVTLTSGNRASKVIEALEAAGVSQDRIVLLSILASPAGVDNVCDRFPDVKIITAAVEFGVDAEGRLVPGMGDFDDRYPADPRA